MEVVKRFEVWLTALEPAVGSEMRKTRPCVVVSPDATNRHLNTVVIVPLTTAPHDYAFRPTVAFASREAQLAIDQVRVLDRQRLLSRMGELNEADSQLVLKFLRRFFT